MAALATGGDPAVRPSACSAFAAMDVPPQKGSNGEQGPDGDNSAKAFFTLTLFLSRSTQRLSTGRQGRGGYETATNPYGSGGSVAEG